MKRAIKVLEDEIEYIRERVMDLEEDELYAYAALFQIQAARLQDAIDVLVEEGE